jgi:hypothetical protein
MPACSNVTDPSIDVVFTVDLGAIYSVVPSEVLRAIGIDPEERETFWLADGRKVRRDVGWASSRCKVAVPRRGWSSAAGATRASSAWSPWRNWA